MQIALMVGGGKRRREAVEAERDDAGAEQSRWQMKATVEKFTGRFGRGRPQLWGLQLLLL